MVEILLSACAPNVMALQRRVEKLCVQTWIDRKREAGITVYKATNCAVPGRGIFEPRFRPDSRHFRALFPLCDVKKWPLAVEKLRVIHSELLMLCW